MDYRDKLKDLRTERGISQAKLAEVLQTTQQYYGKYELRRQHIPTDRLITLCRFYGVSADWLLGLNEKDEQSQ